MKFARKRPGVQPSTNPPDKPPDKGYQRRLTPRPTPPPPLSFPTMSPPLTSYGNVPAPLVVDVDEDGVKVFDRLGLLSTEVMAPGINFRSSEEDGYYSLMDIIEALMGDD